MKFPSFMGEIVTVKANHKQARRYYAESLKVEPYPPTREPPRPHLTIGGGTQVMSVDEWSLV